MDLAEHLFTFDHVPLIGKSYVLLLCPQTAIGVYLAIAHAVSRCSASGGLLSTAAAGVRLSAPASRLSVSASAPDVLRSAAWPAVLLSAIDSQDSVTYQILSIFLDCFHKS
jgi:hypothetical protein